MIEIALLTCSIVSGASCREVTLTFENDNQLVTPYACMMSGQSEISKWIECNLNWSVHRWTCRQAGRYGKA